MDSGRPEEITVIVFRGRDLQGKKKGRGKFSVVFSVGSNKFKSEVVDDPTGNPEWNNEADIHVENPQDPLILKVKEKDDIVGQVVIPLAELPTRRSDRQRCVPLQPHKKCPHPQGDLVFCAWVSKKGAPKDAADQEQPNKTSTLKKLKGAMSHSPLANRKMSLKGGGDPPPSSLGQQAAAMQGLAGSHVSLASNDSSISSKERKSMMKKLKGALSHSPKLGGSKSTSMMNLGPPQALSVASTDPELRGSSESLASQGSGGSHRKMSAMEKLKNKIGKSPALGRKDMKKNSQSMHNLNMLEPEMKTSDKYGSNESLKSSKSNKSGKALKGLFSKGSKKDKSEPIPAAFDLSKPSNPEMFLTPAPDEYGAVPFNDGSQASPNPSARPQPSPASSPPQKPPRTPASGSNSPSSQQLGVDDDNPFKRRNNSVQSRKRPELLHKSPALMRPSPKMPSPNLRRPESDIPLSSPKKSKNVFAINSDINGGDLWADMKSESPSTVKKEEQRTPQMEPKPTKDTTSDDLNPFKEEADTNPFSESNNPDSLNPFSAEPEAQNTNPFSEPPASKTQPSSTPSSHQSHLSHPATGGPMEEPTPRTLRKLRAQFVFTASDDEDDEDGEKHAPDISGISPREGSTEGGTKLTIRGDFLGKSKADIVTLTVCGVDCLPSLHYFSSYKICCTTRPRKPGSGKIVLETRSGGLARSTLDFIFVQPKPEPSPGAHQQKANRDEKAAESSGFFGRKKQEAPVVALVVAAQDSGSSRTAVVEPMSRTTDSTTSAAVTADDVALSKRQAPNPPTLTNNGTHLSGSRDSLDGLGGDYEKDELLRIITTLQAENKQLKDDASTMKKYIDSLMVKVLEHCPEILMKP